MHSKYGFGFLCLKGVLLSFLIIAATNNCEEYEGKGQNDVVSLWPNFNTMFDIRTLYHDKLADRFYIGAVNRIFVLDASNVSNVLGEIIWTPLDFQVEICKSFKSDKVLCQNNVRVLQPINSTHLYTCGTMAFNPTCCYLHKESFTLLESTSQRGKWKIPNNPYVSLSSVIANGLLFTATRGNGRGGHGVVSKSLTTFNLRTLERDEYWLNEPDFVGIYHLREENTLDDKVLVFFREKAEEFRPHDFGMSTNPSQRNTVSRIATVCVNDEGGTGWVLNKNFATYTKMSISCVVMNDKGDASIRYDNLVGTYVMPNKDESHNPTLYGIFNGPEGSNMGSAVCAYSMNDIKQKLNTNEYWNKEGQFPIKDLYNSKFGPAPGNCVRDTRHLNQNRLTFSRNHPIKFGTIFPSVPKPLYRSPNVEYSHIAVINNPSITSSLGTDTTTIFLITKDGKMTRVITNPEFPNLSRTLPDIQLFNTSTGDDVLSVTIGDSHLFVATNSTVLQIPFGVCSLYTSCQKCSESYDPYCLWYPHHGCESVQNSFGLRRQQVKKMSSFSTCADDPKKIDPVQQMINDLLRNISTAERKYESAAKELEIKTINLLELEDSLLQCHVSEQGINQTNNDLENMLSESQNALRIETNKYNSLAALTANCDRKLNWALGEVSNVQRELKKERESVKSILLQTALLQQKQQDSEESLSTCTEALLKSQNETTSLSLDLKTSKIKLIDQKNKCKTLLIRSEKVTRDQIDGFRGQQTCEHNGWFLVNQTGNVFALGRERFNYTNAVKHCATYNSRLAIFRNPEEVRYVHNVMRAFTPNSYFWIGLIKYHNGTLKWSDDTIMKNGDFKKFPRSQRNRLLHGTGEYCVEISPSQRWYLIPCQRPRRTICERHESTRKSRVVRHTTVQLVPDLPTLGSTRGK